MTIGLVTAQARAEETKARRKRNRDAGHPEDGPMTAAHAVAAGADGAREGHDLDEDDCGPGMAGKSYAERGITDGPARPVIPGQIGPEDFRRGYLGAGHGAPSPQHGPPSVPHVDMSGSRGVLTRLDGRNPAGVGNLR